VHPGRTFRRAHQTPEGVTAHFEDGSSATGNVLIGADGVHSAVRAQLWPGPKPRYSGQTSYRALLRFDWRALGELPCAEVWGTHARVGFTPVSNDEMYWYAVHRAPAGVRDTSSEDAKAALLARARGLHPHVCTLIEATPPENMLHTDISDLPALAHWHTGGVALLGDAAHATTPNLGQGGCQAMEDGYVIAQCLAEEATPAAAFARYQQLRKPKADWITRTAHQIGEAAHLPVWLHGLRNALLRATPASVQTRQTNKIYRLNY
jgi:2-polyprenyl-6-methoxyphenol hydroxylase-like FAD-dependent oxidoreductase